jgi:teichuronic acid biosynthesis glycosyltransferase TuaC
MLVKGTATRPSIPTYIESQAASLRAVGWEVVYGYFETPRSFKQLLSTFRDLKDQLTRRQVDVVHAQYGSGSAAIAACIRGSVPLVISFCGSDLLGCNVPKFWWRLRDAGTKRLGVVAAYFAEAVIVKSRNLLDTLPTRLRAKATILPNGVDLRIFRPFGRQECRSLLNWHPDKPIVLFNGQKRATSYANTKNLELAYDAIEQLKKRIPSVTLEVMSGATPTEVVQMMNAADCLLLTSLHEGSANIVKEAMACNLPVVSVNCGDVAERLRACAPSSVCAYEPSKLAAGIESVLNTGHRSNGRARLIEQMLTTEDVARRLIDIYSGVQRAEQNPVSHALRGCRK